MVTIDLFVRGFEGCDLLTWEGYYTMLAAGRMLKKAASIVLASLRGST